MIYNFKENFVIFLQMDAGAAQRWESWEDLNQVQSGNSGWLSAGKDN